MSIQTITLTESNVGCWLDGYRGHYLTRDAVQLAQGVGFIVGPFEQWALDTYDAQSHEDSYPFEGLVELCDDAMAWLNSSPTVREIAGQNMPPARPEGALWAFEDGGFGLWRYDEDGLAE
jgi:hypothetical protein